LVDRFGLAAKMFKQVAKGGVPNVPGVPLPPGVDGGKKLKQQQPPNKKKSKSGNPAKRAAEESGESLRLPGQFKGLLDK
jgi:signal recognition particle subunit SRP54